jgi:carboxymethylenebutenolidase
MGRYREPYAVDDLNQMQRYLGEEMIEDWQHGELTRRQMLRRLLAICGSAAGASALLVACGAETAPVTPASAASPAASVAADQSAAASVAASVGAAPSASTAAAPASSAASAESSASASPAAEASAQPAGSAPLSVPADDPAITAGDTTVQGDVEIQAYLARPSAEGSYPGVIVIHENRGLNDHIRDVARRVAKAGYVALAPDLASRAGGTTAVGPDAIQGFFGNTNPEDLVSDLNAAVEYLGQQEGVEAGKYGVVGFCLGGAYTLRLAAANPEIAAAVAYYGPTPEPADQFSATNAAILGQYGGNDQRVNGTIPALEQVMQANGKTYEKRIYEGANHAFNNDTGQNYNEQAAVAAWEETLGWFEQYLKAS